MKLLLADVASSQATKFVRDKLQKSKAHCRSTCVHVVANVNFLRIQLLLAHVTSSSESKFAQDKAAKFQESTTYSFDHIPMLLTLDQQPTGRHKKDGWAIVLSSIHFSFLHGHTHIYIIIYI